MWKLFSRIIKKDDELTALIEQLENELKDKIEIEFFIFKQTDGWVLADFDMHNILLSKVFEIIEEKGKFTKQDVYDNNFL